MLSIHKIENDGSSLELQKCAILQWNILKSKDFDFFYMCTEQGIINKTVFPSKPFYKMVAAAETAW